MDISLITKICLIVIGLVFIASIIYTIYAKHSNTLIKNRRIIDSLPNVVSTLGVIGTFLGITLGLIDFDPGQIDQSISSLLEGLRTAFYTSLAGMVCSLILRFFVTDKLFDQEEKGVSSTEQASINICNEVRNLTEKLTPYLSKNDQFQQDLIGHIQSIYELNKAAFEKIQSKIDGVSNNTDSISSLQEIIIETKKTQEEQFKNIGTLIEQVKNNTEKQLTIHDAINDIKSGVSSINTNVSELLDTENNNIGILQEQLEETKKFSEILRSEVDEIENKMTETNKMLTAKFDKFSELLQKSNTEALVEVMKKVTAEFQKQMNDLISKLVQENFDQLNNSVEQLNQWQHDNKEMISQLTIQYKQMTNEFENSANLLNSVANDTKTLVGDGGKLSKLIAQLNKVMIEDKKFVEIAAKLEESASLNKQTIAEFDQSNKALESWMLQHTSFVEEVEKLVAKLDELNKIRDYNDQFWKDTKKGMNEGVAIIKDGSEKLHKQLTELDKQFYARLSTTLSELDACIQAIMERHSNF